MVMAVSNLKARHAELGSASIVPNEPTVEADKWPLKHVQGDVAPGISAALNDFAAAVSDDLNTAIAITSLETLIGLKKVDAAQHLAAIGEMDAVLGLNLLALTRQDLRIKPRNATIDEVAIDELLHVRQLAREQKNFPQADEARRLLNKHGVEVMDGDPLGWDWKLDV
jgi:cysteinyl-tRNA synthetase